MSKKWVGRIKQVFGQVLNLIVHVRHLLHLIPKYTVSNREIQELMYQYAPNLSYRVDDVVYRLTTSAMMDWFVGFDRTDASEYTRGIRDCDDFAIMFASHMREFADITAVGIVSDSDTLHTYNVVVVKDGVSNILKFLEPQNYQWVQLGSGKYQGLSGHVRW